MIQRLSMTQCTLFFFHIEQVCTSNGLYARKVPISNEVSSTEGTKNSICACQCYRYEKQPASFEDELSLSRKAKMNEEFSFYGKLAVVDFTCDKFKRSKVQVRLRLVRLRPKFYVITKQNKNFPCFMLQAPHVTPHVAIEDRIFKDLKSLMQLHPARYNFSELLANINVISRGQNQNFHDNVFKNAPTR